MIPEADRKNLSRLASRVWAAWWEFVASEVALHAPPPRPDPSRLTFTVTQEVTSTMAVKFRAVAQLPPLPATPDAADIDHLKVALTVDGAPADPPSQDLPRDATEFDAGLYDAGHALSLSLVYVDAAGNASVHPATADVVISDTTAPPDPGAFAFNVAQEFTPDATEPTPEPVPTEPAPAEGEPSEPPPAA